MTDTTGDFQRLLAVNLRTWRSDRVTRRVIPVHFVHFQSTGEGERNVSGCDRRVWESDKNPKGNKESWKSREMS